MSANELRPVSVEVPAVSPVQLPVLTSGGATITNTDTTNAELSSTQAFSTGTTQVLSPGTSAYFAVGPVWARVPSGSSADQVTLFIAPGPAGGNAAPTALAITNATIPIAGSVDANITNANLPVSGSVDANITNASLTVGGTVSLTAGQVVEVTNASGGSLTVAGTVDATVAGNVTIDAGTVDVQPVAGTLLGTQTGNGSLTVTVSANATAINITVPPTANVQVQGTTSSAFYNAVYGGGQFPGSSAVDDPGLWVCPINVSVDGSYTVTIGNISSTQKWYVSEVFHGATTLLTPAIDGGPNELQLASIAGASYTVSFDSTTEVLLLYNYDVSGDGGQLSNFPTVTYSLAATAVPVPVRPVGFITTVSGVRATVWEAIVLPSVGQEVTVTWADTGGTNSYAVKRSRTTGWPTDPTSWTVAVPSPAAGANWSYTLPFTARLKMVQAVFAASAAVGTRQPVLMINNGPPLALSAAGFTASSGGWVAAYPGGPVPPQMPGGSNVNERGMPDLVLPAGATISTGVGSIQAGDQWQAITLTFAAV